MSFGFGFGFPKNYVAALFSPAQLFTGSTNGVWYDPSDLTTLFQDAAGTTPVTAVEQPVGLMLDKSKGLVLGPELVTNGGFDTDTGWTKGSGWSISGGVASATGTLNNININQPLVLTQGKTYQISVTCINYSSGTFFLLLPDGSTPLGLNVTGVGKKSAIFTASANSSGLLYLSTGLTLTATFDNISVRELPGNHAFNSSGNSANFPVLSAKYNLLTKTEQFDDAAWGKTNLTVTSNATTAPNGTLTANLLKTSGSGGAASTAFQYTTVVSGTQYTYSVFVKAGNVNRVLVGQQYGVSNFTDNIFDLSTNTWVATGAGTVSAMQLANGWYKLSVTVTAVSSQGLQSFVGPINNDGTAYNNTTVDNHIYAWGADRRVSNDALNQPAYQRVNTGSDYDTVGFKPYLKFNGTNQWLQTNSIDFSYGDKMFVCAGVRKLSDAVAMVAELSAHWYLNNGTIRLGSGPDSGADMAAYTLGSHGNNANTTSFVNSPALYPAPITNVVSGVGNISAPSVTLRVNGTQVAQSTASQGTGNYGNYPLYIGARAGSSLWFNGRLHQLIVAGKQASASEIGQTEAFTNQKTGAY